MRVRISNSAQDFEVAREQTVLDAALQVSLNLPHRCKGGNCGLCKARLLRGEIHYPRGKPLGLSAAEIDSGLILLCRAQARSDLELEIAQIRSAHARGPARIPCRIEQARLVAHDVMIVFLRLPPAVSFCFEAGQYLDILLSGDRRRSFSIASPPKNTQRVELHVRRVAGGEWSEWLFGSTSVAGALLSVEGPLGRFCLAEGRPSQGPLLFVGGGTGIAPLLSMLRHLVDNDAEREVILYWGVRGTRDLYAEAAILELRSGLPRMRYVPVLSEPEPEPAWAGRDGFVHAAVLRDLADLAAFDIYAAGPPALIESVRREFPRHGADIDRLHSDSFDYAADTLERQRPSSATKS